MDECKPLSGGIIVLLLSNLDSLSQLYNLTMAGPCICVLGVYGGVLEVYQRCMGVYQACIRGVLGCIRGVGELY